ncbi:glycosyltransferase family 2 protein [Glaciihabitans sp. UYNi722]|uniref:glycosyltransferase family 2 protein n=1 Tax=Glaciihabitans sp. UYNi722 TaxID=3156344 RepID=UPI00339B9372
MSGTTLGVSVALCTRNGEAFIIDQIRSILQQSVLPREIVLSDDASTDSTVERAVETVASHERSVDLVVLRNPKPLGVTLNFEQAVLECRFELIALCDQDDVWYPDKLSRMTARFEHDEHLQLLFSDAQLVGVTGEPLGDSLFHAIGFTGAAVRAVHEGEAFSVLCKRNVVTGATVLVRRDFARAVAPFPAGWVHDEWIAMAASIVGQLDVLDKPLVDYRQHGNNEIGASRLSIFARFARIAEAGFERNRRLLDRATNLAARLPTLPGAVSAKQAHSVKQKLEHERVRSGLSLHRLERITPVFREITTGRYHSFGRGLFDAVRDLLQPLGAPR